MAVAVLGMHRAGTSLTAAVLEALGVDFGEPTTLMGAAEENAAGFWEQEPIVRFNERLLGRLGGTWMAPPPMPSGWHLDRGLHDLVGDARILVDDVFDDPGGLVGWKDPRASLLLPFWQRVLPVERTVVSLREPREVAASLAQRNGIDPEWSAGLWLRHVSAAVLSSDDPLVLDYADWFARPDELLQRCQVHLGLSGDVEGARQLIQDGLRHHDADEVARTPLLDLARELHAQLRAGRGMEASVWQHVAAGRGEAPELGPEYAEAWRAHVEALGRVAVAVLQMATDRERYRVRAHELRGQRDELRGQRDEALEARNTLRDLVEVLRRDQARLQGSSRVSDTGAGQGSTEHTVGDDGLQWKERAEGAEKEVARLQRALDACTEARREADRRRRQAEVDAGRLRAQRDREIRASSS